MLYDFTQNIGIFYKRKDIQRITGNNHENVWKIIKANCDMGLKSLTPGMVAAFEKTDQVYTGFVLVCFLQLMPTKAALQ